MIGANTFGSAYFGQGYAQPGAPTPPPAPSLAMRLITGLVVQSFNGTTVTFDGKNFILESVDGLSLPILRLPRYNLPGASGAYISNALYGERAIKIKGIVNAPDGSRLTYLANRTTLINGLAYQTDNGGTIQPQTLTITLENGLVLTTTGYADTFAMGFSEDQMDYEEFQLTFVCPDPVLFSQNVISGVVQLPVGGGTAIPTAIPASLAASSGGQLILVNTGSASSSPTIVLNGPLTNPYITNLRTGQFLKFNYTINLGDQPVIINCLTQSITQGANTKNGIQSADSTFWSVLSGSNTIGFSASGGTGTGSVSFNPSFLGV
jgi:Phage tail protein